MTGRNRFRYLLVVVPIVPAETALPGCGCSREFTALGAFVEDDLVSTIFEDAFRCLHYERFVAIAGKSQYIRVGR